MPFPEATRVLYKRNPLIAVVLQLRFPTILRVDTELPALFQERIRVQYPIFDQVPGMNVISSLEASSPVNPQFNWGLKSYNFVSADRNWTVSLTRDFLAVATTKYERWDDFKSHFQEPLKAFIEIYNPYNFSRVGLRYQDIIRRSALGLEDVKWSDLLQPQIAGALSSTNIEADIETTYTQMSVSLSNEGHVQINHGFVMQPESNEICYLIDSDFFTNNATEIDNVTEILDAFNEQSRYLFQWCLKERLHRAMEP